MLMKWVATPYRRAISSGRIKFMWMSMMLLKMKKMAGLIIDDGDYNTAATCRDDIARGMWFLYERELTCHVSHLTLKIYSFLK